MILTIRTDKPESEVGLYEGGKKLEYIVWHAHRQLAESIHSTLDELLKARHKDWPDLTGIVVYQGPGSFTGLRIGMSVANALAYSLAVPITSASGSAWISEGIQKLQQKQGGSYALPDYGSPAYTTPPKR